MEIGEKVNFVPFGSNLPFSIAKQGQELALHSLLLPNGRWFAVLSTLKAGTYLGIDVLAV